MSLVEKKVGLGLQNFLRIVFQVEKITGFGALVESVSGIETGKSRV